MKRGISIVLLMCCIAFSSGGQTKADTLLQRQVTELSKAVKANSLQIEKIAKTIEDGRSKSKPIKLDFWQKLLVFSPFILFIVVLLLINSRLGNSFSLADAVSESELAKKTEKNPEYNAANLTALANVAVVAGSLSTILPPTIETSTTTYPRSASRYIAFITSGLTWVIALTLACYFMYESIATGEAPDLSKFSNVLLSLGIGVVPYAFNKVSSAVKPS